MRRAFSNESVRRRFERAIVLELKAKAGYFASEQPLLRYGQSVPLDRCLPELGGKWTSLFRVQRNGGDNNQLELTTDKQ